jgi:hypothetical protein
MENISDNMTTQERNSIDMARLRLDTSQRLLVVDINANHRQHLGTSDKTVDDTVFGEVKSSDEAGHVKTAEVKDRVRHK